MTTESNPFGFVPVSAGLAGSLLGPTRLTYVRHHPERTIVVYMSAWYAGDVEQVVATVQGIYPGGWTMELLDVAFADAARPPSGAVAGTILDPPQPQEEGDRRMALLKRIDSLLAA